MYKMEIDRILSHSSLYALPVGGVLILAILVFAFGFRTVTEPKFESTKNLVEDRKKKQPKSKSKVSNYFSLCLLKIVPLLHWLKPEDILSLSLKLIFSIYIILLKGETKKTTVVTTAKPVVKKDSPKKTSKVEATPAVVVEKEIKNKQALKQASKALKNEPKPADFDEGMWLSLRLISIPKYVLMMKLVFFLQESGYKLSPKRKRRSVQKLLLPMVYVLTSL